MRSTRSISLLMVHAARTFLQRILQPVLIPGAISIPSLSFGGSSPRPPDCPDLSSLSSATEEPVAAIGVESRNLDSTWHLKRLKNLSGSRIDSPQVALVTFQGAVPEFAI